MVAVDLGDGELLSIAEIDEKEKREAPSLVEDLETEAQHWGDRDG